MTRNTIAFDQEQRDMEEEEWGCANPVGCGCDRDIRHECPFGVRKPVPMSAAGRWELAARDEGLLKAAEQWGDIRKFTGTPLTGWGEFR